MCKHSTISVSLVISETFSSSLYFIFDQHLIQPYCAVFTVHICYCRDMQTVHGRMPQRFEKFINYCFSTNPSNCKCCIVDLWLSMGLPSWTPGLFYIILHYTLCVGFRMEVVTSFSVLTLLVAWQDGLPFVNTCWTSSPQILFFILTWSNHQKNRPDKREPKVILICYLRVLCIVLHDILSWQHISFWMHFMKISYRILWVSYVLRFIFVCRAPCGLRGCKNRPTPVSWPDVVKGD